MRKTLAGAILALAVLAVPAAAATKPGEVAAVIHADQPYGEGDVTFLFSKVYEACLWTDAATWSMNKPFALALTYGMNFSSADLVDRTMSEMQHVAPGMNAATQARYRAMLPKLFPGVKPGDTITAMNVPGAPTRFYRNGVFIGQSDDAAFAAPFFAIWLSPATSDPDLRKQLLARNR